MTDEQCELAQRLLLFLASEGEAQRSVMKVPATGAAGTGVQVTVHAGWRMQIGHGATFELALKDALDGYDEDP